MTTASTIRTVTEDEQALLTHVTMWGSDGYPVHKLGKGWTWGFRSIQGPPVVFKTKRAAVESLEAFLGVLRQANAALRQREAIRDRIATGASVEDVAAYMVRCGAGELGACLAKVRESIA